VIYSCRALLQILDEALKKPAKDIHTSLFGQIIKTEKHQLII
jgi:hypothetical protein